MAPSQDSRKNVILLLRLLGSRPGIGYLNCLPPWALAFLIVVLKLLD